MFDIAKRNEQGLWVYDDEFRRRLMTPKEISESDSWVKKHSELIAAKKRGEISKEEYEFLCNELDSEHEKNLDRIYDEDFGSKKQSTLEKSFSVAPHFATA